MVDSRALIRKRPSRHRDVDDTLRVLVVTSSRVVWGAERSILGMAPLLRARGIELTLGSPGGGDLCEAWAATGLPRVDVPLPVHQGIRAAGGGRPGPGALAGELRATAAGARMVARASRPMDVIHSNSLWGHLDCVLGGRLAGRPVVLELHDLVRPGMGRHLLRVATALSSGVMAISNAVAATAGMSPSVDNGRFRIVPQAVDTERFHPGAADPELRLLLGRDPALPTVGIVGRIDPEKGVDVVVRAMSLLGGSAARCQLAVIGAPGLDPGDYERQVRSEAADLLGDHVRFTGPLSDVPGALRSLDVVVNASAAEPFGLSVLEAQASGVAVIGTAAGGIPEFVADGDTGLLVPPGDAPALAAALRRLLDDGDLRARLGRNGRSAVEAHHGLGGRADAVAAMYRSVAKGR
jgi:glycosyltransferase involved in cell wall biosynthesis